VANRVAYGLGDGALNRHSVVLLGSANKEDILDALINFSGEESERQSLEAMLNLLLTEIGGDFSVVNADLGEDVRTHRIGEFDSSKRKRRPLQAQILGGFDVDEIEQVNYPFTVLNRISVNEDISDVVNDQFIKKAMTSAGLNEEELEYAESVGITKRTETPSMQMLRNYRMAQKLRSKFKEKGVPKFVIAHPSGLNIEEASTHSKAAKPGDNVEKVLLMEIRKEIGEIAQKLLKELGNAKRPSLVSRRGGKI